MKSLKPFISLSLAAACILIASCATAPNFGEKLKEKQGAVAKIGSKWEKGNAAVKKGEQLIETGESQQKKGRKNVRKGEDLVSKGSKMKKEAEKAYNSQKSREDSN